MRTALVVLLASTAFTFVGCARKPAADVSTVPITSAKAKRANVQVDDEIMRLCAIHIGDVDRAPKFDFDDAELLPEDKDVLEQVAKCVTSGPLKGRKVALVGRADPRGDTEYNMILGEFRADNVSTFLSNLGVNPTQMVNTSRGELDAEGTDEESWRRDRRVDIVLLAREPLAAK